MIIEFNFGALIATLIGFLIGFVVGGMVFAILIYFPDFKRTWRSIKFVYKYKKEMKNE